jgi:hypothetical protein
LPICAVCWTGCAGELERSRQRESHEVRIGEQWMGAAVRRGYNDRFVKIHVSATKVPIVLPLLLVASLR